MKLRQMAQFHSRFNRPPRRSATAWNSGLMFFQPVKL